VTSDELERRRQGAANGRSKAGSGDGSAQRETALAGQRGQITALQAREREIRVLRERKRTLEVECIAAEAAVRAAGSGTRPDPDHGTAWEIIQSLDRRRALQRTLTTLDQRLDATTDANTGELGRLRAAQDALRAWLDAPRRQALDRTRRPVRIGLLTAMVAAIVAAIAIHPALLLLVLPLAPISILLRPGQDTEWQRLGAKQRLQETGLAAPDEWTERTVRARAAELEAAMDTASQQAEGPAVEYEALESERTAVATQLAAEDEQFATRMTEAALDSEALDKDFERRLRLVAQVHRTRHALARLKETLKQESADAEELRDRLRRYLAHQGEIPADGRADTAALTAGLDRLAVGGRKADSE